MKSHAIVKTSKGEKKKYAQFQFIAHHCQENMEGNMILTGCVGSVGSTGLATTNLMNSWPAALRIEATCCAPMPHNLTSPTCSKWSPFWRWPS